MTEYVRLSRSQTYSLLFALPLLLMYEFGAAHLAASGDSLRNGADVLLRVLLASGGLEGTVQFTAALIATGAVLIFLERRRRPIPLRASVFLGMAAESLGYALVFGAIVGTATQWILQGVSFNLAIQDGQFATLSLEQGIVLSLGAGIYEELVFRVLLVGGMFGVFRSSGLGRNQAGLFAAVLAALIFSGFHYIGPYGDAWGVPSFIFRFIAGLAFSILFLLRGFGIAAWTHALYDVVLFVARANPLLE